MTRRLLLLILCTWAAGAQTPPLATVDGEGTSTAETATSTTSTTDDATAGTAAEPLRKVGPRTVKILHVTPDPYQQHYPGALGSLLESLDDVTTVRIDPSPVMVRNFEDPTIFEHPFIYTNFGDREDWALSEVERRNLKHYLERGGFLFVDAGISASFLRGHRSLGQHHSFGEWEAHPDLEAAFEGIWPGRKFRPLPRTHALYRSVYRGLPDPANLPDTVRDYVVNEKWPDGTYSAVGLRVRGRLAVVAMPIIAMGWGKNQLGNWRTDIGFRIRESAPNLAERLETAAYAGERYETRREDGGQDIIYCQSPGTPAWVQEPGGRYRVFRYYYSDEINDFAHQFYTQLGVNIITHALTH